MVLRDALRRSVYVREHRTRKRGNGGAVQQRGQIRLETCSQRSKKSSEDRKHTSVGEIDSNLGAVIGKEEGAVTSIPRNE